MTTENRVKARFKKVRPENAWVFDFTTSTANQGVTWLSGTFRWFADFPPEWAEVQPD